ncbi:MAG TPA: RNase H family protein [Candidatus Paceibacterota bacterium]
MNEKVGYIFTDGSSRGNPGPGGWGAIVVFDFQFSTFSDEVKVTELGGYEDRTTNNRMELTAVIKALEFLNASAEGGSASGGKSYKLFSDSRYVINGASKWVHGWKKNNWITSSKNPVQNKDLWEELDYLAQTAALNWVYVGGHVGIAANERCDQIATAFADGKKVELYSGILANYALKNILDMSTDSAKEVSKSSTRARGRAKAFSYVSKVHGKIETHKTWADCEARIKGQSGALYRKTLSKEEEKSLINLWRNA